MTGLATFVCGRFRDKSSTPPARITAPEAPPMDGYKLLADHRLAYFDQSRRTVAGQVATFTSNRSTTA